MGRKKCASSHIFFEKSGKVHSKDSSSCSSSGSRGGGSGGSTPPSAPWSEGGGRAEKDFAVNHQESTHPGQAAALHTLPKERSTSARGSSRQPSRLLAGGPVGRSRGMGFGGCPCLDSRAVAALPSHHSPSPGSNRCRKQLRIVWPVAVGQCARMGSVEGRGVRGGVLPSMLGEASGTGPGNPPNPVRAGEGSGQ